MTKKEKQNSQRIQNKSEYDRTSSSPSLMTPYVLINIFYCVESKENKPVSMMSLSESHVS